ncbi:ran-binding protein 3 [Phymastichus coffea]|uniref:ran-binding protein 3 n=1 Tax=Phymastichus coffea TaxID=108790 RepID=UPI00273C8A4F|nr:ran-binding protein 3 [Phymastichus coffea]
MADCKESSNEETSKEPEPMVTMKFHSPDESSDNSVNDEVEKGSAEKDSDNSSSSNSLPHNSVSKSPDKKSKRLFTLKASAFLPGSSTFSEKSSCSSKPKTSLLRPSALSSVTSCGTSAKSVLKPSKFQNPFSKVTDDLEDGESAAHSESNKDEDAEKGTKDENDKEEKDKDEKEEEKEKEVPKFLALSKSTNAKENENSFSSAVTAGASKASSFVFGQNLKERVAVAHNADSSDSSEKEEVKEEPTNANGSSSSELMFSNAAAVCKTSNDSKPSLTLSEAAHELEEANRANKRKYSEVALLTGEEDETNVLQINCKLFAFDKATSSYQERGRGFLRLNDKDDESRLIGRAAGTQRLVLNTKVWPGMTAERAGPKSLRLTAMDAQGEIRIFVVQAAQKEVEQLHNLLMQRLTRAQERKPKKLATEH